MARRIAAGMNTSFDLYHEVDALAAALKEHKKTQTPNLAPTVESMEKQIKAIQEGTHEAPGIGPVNRDFSRLLNGVEAADERPTEPQTQAVAETCSQFKKVLAQWNALNDSLRKENPLRLPMAASVSSEVCTE